ncbi:MAG: hypothetical protein KGJ60_15885, partial [Verrucomicrobiota bacterium]|nr:hypothetical protein [Verrucomicrobiota bacterium]
MHEEIYHWPIISPNLTKKFSGNPSAESDADHSPKPFICGSRGGSTRKMFLDRSLAFDQGTGKPVEVPFELWPARWSPNRCLAGCSASALQTEIKSEF